jgi:hypothetical protein
MSALMPNSHNPVDATAAPITKALPTGLAGGTEISVEKYDATANAVTLTGNIRGAAAQSIALTLARETVSFRADSSGSWWPIGDHKTLSSLVGAFGAVLAGPQNLISSMAFVAASGDTTGVADTAALQALITAGTPFATGSGLYYLKNLIVRSGTHWRPFGTRVKLPDGSAAGARVLVGDRFDDFLTEPAITGVTTASPAVITTAIPHRRQTGDAVTVSGVLGATEVNGVFVVTVVDATHLSVPVSVAGAYTSGGKVISNGGGITGYSIVGKMSIDGNSANNPSAGDAVALYGCAGVTSGIDVHDATGRAWRNEWRTSSFPPPVGSASYMSQCQFSGAGGGLLWNGPNDSRLSDITAPKCGHIGIHFGPSSPGTFGQGLHAWGGNLASFMPYLVEAEVELTACEGAGIGSAPSMRTLMVIAASGVRVNGGKYFLDATDTTVTGFQIGTSAAIPEALGAASTGPVSVTSTRLRARVYHCGAGAVRFDNSAGSNAAEILHVFASAGVVIGNQAGMLTSDTLGLITFTGGCTGPQPGTFVAPIANLTAVDVVAGTTYTLAAADALRTKRFTAATTVTVTIPTQATMAAGLAWGAALNVPIFLLQYGVGKVSIVGAAGVTIRSVYGAAPSVRAQYGVAVLQMIATDEWLIAGAISP